MHPITTNYDLKLQVKGNPHLQLTSDLIMVNIKRGVVVNPKPNCRSIGYWAGRDFIPLSKLAEHIEPIPNIDVPF